MSSKERNKMDIDIEEGIVDVLCSQALADHLGDVRDAEFTLWELLGISREDLVNDYENAWQNTKATLAKYNISLPAYLRE